MNMEINTNKSLGVNSASKNNYDYNVNNNTSTDQAANFTDLLNMALGNTGNTNKAQKYSDFTSNSKFDDETEDIFKQFSESGFSISSLHVVKNYLKELKDQEKFEEAIRKLVEMANKSSQSAEDALTLLNLIEERLNPSDKSKPDKLQMIKSAISEIESKLSPLVHSKETINAVNKLSLAMNSEKYSDKSANKLSSDEVINDLNKSLERDKKESKEAAQLFNHIANYKVKKTKKYDPDLSTEKALKRIKQLEELDNKIKEIMNSANRMKEISGNTDINTVIEAMTNTNTKFSNIHLTDIPRLDNNYLASPVFA
jgi:DNA repair exonuclease SbcCD ATPase subunit